jgi:hypothetical protein
MVNQLPSLTVFAVYAPISVVLSLSSVAAGSAPVWI